MDSDSSMDEEHNRGWNQSKQDPIPVRPNINEENSDVSDEENISRAARSIESPPESPQGTHFESPPASPEPENKPGTPSPIQSPDDSASYGSPSRSPDSQTGSRNQKNDSPPRSPDSFQPRSPRSPSPQFANQSPLSNHEHDKRSPRTKYPQSPSPVRSPSSNHSRNKSPIQSPAPHYGGIRSPSPNSNSIRSPSPYRNRSESPSRSQSSPRNASSPTRFKGRRTPSNSPQSGNCSPSLPQRTRRNSNMSDDGRSNISSASSFSSPHHSPPRTRTPPEKPQISAPLKSHVEDLSDVSDLESLNSMSDVEDNENPQRKENGDVRGGGNESAPMRNTSSGGLEADDAEQLDFEAEDKEEGECDVSRTKGPDTEAVLSEDEGELKGDELEEGEITDEGENRPEETEPRPICRFYNRGQCTWGSSCRFVHPGVTDKGNYTMFDMVRPLVPVNGPPPMYGPPIDPYRPIDRPVMPIIPPVYPQPIVPRKEEPVPVVESAWERGLRQAKEMLRKSSKRKETEVDFEEKKMNLSLGQDDLDKENDYYTRPASPVMIDEPDRWGSKGEPEAKRYRTMSDRFDDYGGGAEGIYYPRNTEQVWHQRPHYDESMRAVYSSSRSSKYYSRGSREKEYYPSSTSSSKRQKYSQREVIVQRPEKTSWKDDSPPPARPSRYPEARGGGARGDEWADPWMRKKTSSPLTRKRKQSYSSGSSYSSSSSSRSSHSSSSSYSRSRSRSSRSRSRSKPAPTRRLTRPSPPAGRAAKVPLSPALLSEKKATTERSILMNPPPPSPRGKNKNLATNPSPPIDRPGVPARLLAHSKAASAVAAAMRSARSRSKSSRSSGSSDSSGSSSDSSESSFSSSSSSRPASPSPPVRQKRIVIDERLALAQAMKVKAMDALKLSGQKQQIKLTLKGSGAGDRPTAPVPTIGKKRPAESPPLDFSPPKVGAKLTPKKTAPSRREELLKQLKAVEDAIARKRSKIS